MNKIILPLLFILIATFNISAQVSIHKYITTEDGLVQGQISSMIQDSKGYIWFGTYDGVSMWDGNNFVNFQTQNGLPAAQVTDIKEDLDGKIYIAAFRGGILVYNNGVLDTLNESNGLVSNGATHINVLKNGDIIFCGTNGGITKLRNGELINWGKQINFPTTSSSIIWDSYESEDGKLYLASQNGLYILHKNILTNFTTKNGLNHNLLRTVTGDKNGVIYIGSFKGVNKIVNQKITALKINNKSINSFVFKILVSDKGTIYYATSDGVIKEKDQYVSIINENNGLPFNESWSALEDSNNKIFFGSNGMGASIYNPKERIVNFNKNTGLPNESIWAIHENSKGTFYFGSVDGLIIKTGHSYKTITTKNGLTGNFIREIFEDNNGNIYLATNSGLNVLKNDKIKTFTTKNGLLANQIHAIAQDNDGDILLATQNGISVLRDGIVNKNKSNELTNGIKNGLDVSNIQTITIVNNNHIYFGTFNGVAIYNSGKFEYLTKDNGLVDNVINTSFVNSKGSVLVGTFKGINIIQDGEVIDTIDVSDGLSNNSISDITEGNNGDLYISTFSGLNILSDSNNTFTIRSLFKKDGLVDNDFTQEGSYIDSKGNLWLGTLYGVSKYNPNTDLPNLIPPKIYITGLEIFNKPYPIETLKNNNGLNYNQNYLKFSYTGINLSSPKNTLYNYRLVGVDQNWISSIETDIQYTSLDDGKYTFEVKARNEWGYWSEPTSISFVINPAWWETWWFYSLVILSIGFLIAFFSSYKYRHLLAIEKMRSKISADLHDSVGSGLSEISILSELLGAQVPESNKDIKSGMGNISTISRTLIESMSDIVWLVNPKKDTLKDLFKRLQMSYHEILKYTDIDLSVENIDELENIRLPMNFRQHLYLIFKEAINNAIKYSEGDILNLSISTSGNKLTVVFSDNGKGFDQTDGKMGNGLINMKNRAKEIGGEMEYTSQINKGTIIKFTGKFKNQKSSLI